MTPQIESHPDAPMGSVQQLPNYTAESFPVGCAILCRNNAPLVTFAISLLRRRIPCSVMGRDLGAQLKTLIKSWKAQTIEELRERCTQYFDRANARAKSKRQRANLEDRQDCLRILMADAGTPADVIDTIDSLFTAKAAHVQLATMHKSKGLEWPDIFILDRGLCPSKYAESSD